jgi:hypothetical protein
MNNARMLHSTGEWTADPDPGSDPEKDKTGRGEEPKDEEKE